MNSSSEIKIKAIERLLSCMANIMSDRNMDDAIMMKEPYVDEYKMKHYELWCHGRLLFHYEVALENLAIVYDPTASPFEFPIWGFQIIPPYYNDLDKILCNLSSKVFSVDLKDITIEETAKEITRLPDSYDNDKIVICDTIKDVFEKTIDIDEIQYDFVHRCYFLNLKTEKELVETLCSPTSSATPERLAKYCSYETLLAILNSGKIRLNSLAAMNDKTEVDLFADVVMSNRGKMDPKHIQYWLADRYFITSFTERIDDLDMWRLYGDDARGAMMVFDIPKTDKRVVESIHYLSPEKKQILNIFQQKMAEEQIDFLFQNLYQNGHFYKHSDYKSEKEHRLVMYRPFADGWYADNNNNILNPYIELALDMHSQTLQPFPLWLSAIVVGPAMKNAEVNALQLKVMRRQKGLECAVYTSSVKSYRG